MNLAKVVYALCDPFTMEPKYVGMTANLRKRVYGHCSVGRKWIEGIAAREWRESPEEQVYSVWIGGLLARGLMPAVVVLEEVKGGDLREREAYWIRRLEAEGKALLNEECVKRRAIAGETAPTCGECHSLRELAAFLMERAEQKEYGDDYADRAYSSWFLDRHDFDEPCGGTILRGEARRSLARMRRQRAARVRRSMTLRGGESG